MVIKINTDKLCIIDIDWEHSTLDTSIFNYMSPECLEKVNTLYEAGHTHCSARHQFMKDLRINYPDISYRQKSMRIKH